MRDDETFDSEIDDEGRNLTQQRIDDDGADPVPVDADWTGDEPSEDEEDAFESL